MADPAEDLLQDASRRHPGLAAGGVVDGEPVTWTGDPARQFQIGSVTKLFTSLVLATYVVDGGLRLEQPVGDLLPDLTGPAAGATLEQLATHTSGLPRIPRELWPRAVRLHPDPYADLDHEFLIRSLARTRLRRPGRPAYSNLGAGLLGHALATHAGRTFDELVRDRVTGPLGMADTGCLPETETPGHRRRGKPLGRVWHFDSLAGAGALWSTLGDLQRFLVAQLEPPAGPLGEAIRLSREARVSGRRVDHCLGWLRLHGRDGVLWFHNGGTAGYRSFVGVQARPVSAVAVLGASNRLVDGVGIRLLRTLAG